MMTASKILFIADGPLDRPLLHSQGLPLLRRLAAQGVTCWLQSHESTPEVPRSPLGRDLEARGIRWSLTLDLRLMLATIPAVLSRRGAR